MTYVFCSLNISHPTKYLNEFNVVSVRTATETVVMIFTDFKGRVAFVVKGAAGKSAPVNIKTVVSNKIFQIDPILYVLKNILSHISSLNIFVFDRGRYNWQARQHFSDKIS